MGAGGLGPGEETEYRWGTTRKAPAVTGDAGTRDRRARPVAPPSALRLALRGARTRGATRCSLNGGSRRRRRRRRRPSPHLPPLLPASGPVLPPSPRPSDTVRSASPRGARGREEGPRSYV